MSNDDRALIQYGSPADIKLLAKRIKYMMPGGQRYTDQEAFALSQLCLAHDLDPFNGEAWLMKKKDGTVIGAIIGIKGLRKHAKRQADYWGAGNNGGFNRILDAMKLAEYGCTKDDVVYEYYICDNVYQDRWKEGLKELHDMGWDAKDARDALGQRPPVTMGIGIWKAGEQTKMKPVQASMFRGEKDALKRRFDVQFMVALQSPVIVSSAPDPTPEEIQATIEELEAEDYDMNLTDGEFEDVLDPPNDAESYDKIPPEDQHEIENEDPEIGEDEAARTLLKSAIFHLDEFAHLNDEQIDERIDQILAKRKSKLPDQPPLSVKRDPVNGKMFK